MRKTIFCECCNCLTEHEVKKVNDLVIVTCCECGEETAEREREPRHQRRRTERETRDGRR